MPRDPMEGRRTRALHAALPFLPALLVGLLAIILTLAGCADGDDLTGTGGFDTRASSGDDDRGDDDDGDDNDDDDGSDDDDGGDDDGGDDG